MLLNKQCFTTIVLKATALSTILLGFKIQNLKFKNSKILISASLERSAKAVQRFKI